ncbi:AEC family transporter [Marinobacterium rhizophilum]|uniref:AEC family transporter n=1 Tax=Marinobacterium rhizophilum TaxID=420402 RepID=A0ABY5HGX9_9GAMM|nr:AEC family transporter [Marinobacterium rhizophilum]UTW11498.1 AEC family transporter [Marinobacterium rhizophilum]
MDNPLAHLNQIFAVTGPVFIMVLVGLLLKKVRLIDDEFINTASSLTFKATMPTLLFLGILKADLDEALQPALVGYFCLATALSFAVAWLWALRGVRHEDRGIYVQGAFRGNCGIVSLALAANQYGDYGLSTGAVMSGIVIVLFNILSTLVLSVYSAGQSVQVRPVLKGLACNPLILSVIAGLLASLMEVSLPGWLMVSGEYFGSITLPIALICVGGSLSLSSLQQSGRTALGASLIKVLWVPLIFTVLAWGLGFGGRELGILFLFLASPTAAASFVMARAMGSDGRLAASIIALSTLLSVVTIMAGLFLLEWGIGG